MILRNGNTIHLQGKTVSYVMFVDEYGDLLHFYFGKKIGDRDYSLMKNEWSRGGGFSSNFFGLDGQAQEYPSYGRTDLRVPAYELCNKFNNTVGELKFKDAAVHLGETAEIPDMPCLFKGNEHADTLEVILADEAVDFEVRLYYTVFDEYDIIARNAVLVNNSQSETALNSAFSLCLDLPMGGYDFIYFPGAWGREREMRRTPLNLGLEARASAARGGSSSQMSPFVMIADRGADETCGSVYGFSLIYSGNHASIAAMDHNGNLRVLQGINPDTFAWNLKPGESFCTPQSVMCYSCEGFGKMSRQYHDLFRNNLMQSSWTHRDRPVLVNNWEGTYFDFTEEKLLSIAKRAKEADIELFVLDDGWFGERDDDTKGLGDWFVNTKKLPGGIKGLAEKVNAAGLDFGLWVEPEMVNPDSDLFRAHPDWAVSVKERTPVEARNQLILDLSRRDVCDYVIKAICDVIGSANIKYIKWDMNRQMTDMPRAGYNHEYT
ncbi:MAG: alpha-galactosidase, partial [Clostridiales bacterium]|nr:alpha-galactosidase [Clostridiales bacterium]